MKLVHVSLTSICALDTRLMMRLMELSARQLFADLPQLRRTIRQTKFRKIHVHVSNFVVANTDALRKWSEVLLSTGLVVKNQVVMSSSITLVILRHGQKYRVSGLTPDASML